MRIFLAILSGFVLTLAAYGGGIFTAIFFLDAEPLPDRAPNLTAAALWTSEPVAVSRATQDLDRLPARPVRQVPADATQAEANGPEIVASAEPLVDTTTTASIPPDPTPQPQPALHVMIPAHVEWCSRRYRSYQPANNSYTAYSGETRECVSPFSETGAPHETPAYVEASVDRPFVGYATEDEPTGGYLTREHVQSCFERYRSYRPEDNTYQPYGGGPRRQCR